MIWKRIFLTNMLRYLEVIKQRQSVLKQLMQIIKIILEFAKNAYMILLNHIKYTNDIHRLS